MKVDKQIIKLINEKIKSGVSKKAVIDKSGVSKPTLDLALMGEMSNKTKLALAGYLGKGIEVNETLVDIKKVKK